MKYRSFAKVFLWFLSKLTSSISVVYLGLHIHLYGDDDQSAKYRHFVFGLAITSHSVENKTHIKVLLTLKISGYQTSFAEAP